MAILAAAKIYLATVIFGALSDIQNTVTDWVNTAFANEQLLPTFHVMETLVSSKDTMYLFSL